MMAGIWLPNILQVVWWRFNAWGYLSAWVANLGVSWLIVWVLPSFGVIPELPDHVQFWSLMAAGAVVFLPATLLTKPEPMEHLVAYYVMTRPIGAWGPVRREAERRGLIEPRAPTEHPVRRPFIRRTWTPEDADEWTREDWIAIVLSPIVFGAIMIGVAKLILLQPAGLLLTLCGAALSVVIYWVIDPKLRAVSQEYEAKQAKYLEVLERRLHWEYGDRLDEVRSARKEP
jgi:hypothetical protein